MSTTQSHPASMYPSAALTAPCRLRPARNPELCALNGWLRIGWNTGRSACWLHRAVTGGIPGSRTPPSGWGS